MQTQENKQQIEKDLNLIKQQEDLIEQYKQEEEKKSEKISTYRHLAYKVKNPFKGV